MSGAMISICGLNVLHGAGGLTVVGARLPKVMRSPTAESEPASFLRSQSCVSDLNHIATQRHLLARREMEAELGAAPQHVLGGARPFMLDQPAQFGLEEAMPK